MSSVHDEGASALEECVVWLGAGEAAARLGLPVRAVIERARTGDIPHVLGPIGAPRFSAADIEALRQPRSVAG